VLHGNKLIIRILVFVPSINTNVRNSFTNLYLTFQEMTEFIQSKATVKINITKREVSVLHVVASK
jgi:hypothetical protein